MSLNIDKYNASIFSLMDPTYAVETEKLQYNIMRKQLLCI